MTTQNIRDTQRKIGARRPNWELQEDAEGLPETLTAGVHLRDSIKAPIHVALRESLHHKTARIEITDAGFTQLDGPTGEEISVNIDEEGAITYAVQGGDAPEDVASGLADEINGDASLSALVEATAIDNEVVITGNDEDNYQLDVTDTGDIEYSVTQDANSCQIRVYLLPKGRGQVPQAWTILNGGEFTIPSFRGWTERFVAAGFDRMYVEVHNVDVGGGSHLESGQVKVHIGPTTG